MIERRPDAMGPLTDAIIEVKLSITIISSVTHRKSFVQHERFTSVNGVAKAVAGGWECRPI